MTHKLIIEIPCNDGEEMENNLNKAIDDFGVALKYRGFREMELIAQNIGSELIYKVTISEKNETSVEDTSAMQMLIDYIDKTYPDSGIAYDIKHLIKTSLLKQELEDKKKEAEKAFKRGYALGHEGGCIEGAGGYYEDACWRTYKHENKL